MQCDTHSTMLISLFALLPYKVLVAVLTTVFLLVYANIKRKRNAIKYGTKINLVKQIHVLRCVIYVCDICPDRTLRVKSNFVMVMIFCCHGDIQNYP